VQEAEIGLDLPVLKLTVRKLLEAIKEVTTDPKYRENSAILSDIYKNSPKDPLKDAVFWLEHQMKYRKHFEEEPKEVIFWAEVEFYLQIYAIYRLAKWFFKKLVNRYKFNKLNAVLIMILSIIIYDFLSLMKFKERNEFKLPTET
jgi:hypothetical protein